MDYFREIIHLVYLVKQLHSLNKLDVIESYLNSSITAGGEFDFDLGYEIANMVIDGLFERSAYYYNEDRGVNTCVMTGKVLSDYYLLADEYGKSHGLSDKNNPYIKAACDAGGSRFNFSYTLGWFLEHRPESKSPYKSKLVLLWDEEIDFSLTCIAIGIAGMYSFFTEKAAELQAQSIQAPAFQPLSVKEATAA